METISNGNKYLNVKLCKKTIDYDFDIACIEHNFNNMSINRYLYNIFSKDIEEYSVLFNFNVICDDDFYNITGEIITLELLLDKIKSELLKFLIKK